MFLGKVKGLKIKTAIHCCTVPLFSSLCLVEGVSLQLVIATGLPVFFCSLVLLLHSFFSIMVYVKGRGFWEVTLNPSPSFSTK